LTVAVPKPKKRRRAEGEQLGLGLTSATGFTVTVDGKTEAYNPTEFIQAVRRQVDQWRALPNPQDWKAKVLL